MTDKPILWNPDVPGLQLTWDATSLRAIMQCPRAYQYGLIEGFRSTRDMMKIENGSHYHAAWETIERALLRGAGAAEALRAGLRQALADTLIEEPYLTCTACQYELPAPDLSECPKCRSDLGAHPPASAVRSRPWLGDGKAYGREQLLRAICWSFEALWSEHMIPPALADGREAVEMSFAFPFVPVAGHDMWLCGNMDGLRSWDDTVYPAERKTTGSSLGTWYYATFRPNIQIGVYDLAGQVLYPTMAGNGVVLEATQFAVSFARSERLLIPVSPAQREEYVSEIELAMASAIRYAEAQHWPMNFAACPMCRFREVCAQQPDDRERHLRNLFVRKRWNPLDRGTNAE